MRFCTGCGTPLEEGARFCGMCGAAVIPPSAPSVPEPEKKAEPESPGKPAIPAGPAGPRYFRPSAPSRNPDSERPSFFENYTPAFRGPRSSPQPAAENRYAPPPGQARPSFGYPANSRGRSVPPARKSPQKHRGALKFLSFLFALGLLAVSAGLAGRIWFSRYADRSLKTYAEKERITEDFSARRQSLFAEALAASIDSDVRAGLEAQAMFAGGNAESSGISEITSGKLEEYQEFNDSALEKAARKFGFRWTVLRFSRIAEPVMIGGGILCGVSLALWFALGGRLSRFSGTAATPLLTMFAIWAVCALLLALLLPAVDWYDIGMPYRLIGEPASPAGMPDSDPAVIETIPLLEDGAPPSPEDFGEFTWQ